MEINGFIKAIIGVIVAFVVIAIVAVPIIGGFTESSDGLAENTAIDAGLESYSLFELRPDTTISVTGGVISIGDSEYSDTIMAVLTESAGVYITVSGVSSTISSVENNSMKSYNSINIAYDGSTITLSGTSSNQYSASEAFVMMPRMSSPAWATDAEWVQATAMSGVKTADVYVNDDTQIIAQLGSNIPAYFSGTYSDMTVHNVPFGDFTIDLTYESAGSAVHITGYTEPTQGINLFVPRTYQATPQTQPAVTGTLADLINIIPLIFSVGLIIAAVAAFITLKSRGGGA